MTDTAGPWVRWPGYIAWGFLALLPISVLVVRSGNWQQGLLLYALTCLLSLLLLAFMGIQSLLPAMRDERATILKGALPLLPGAALLIIAMQAGDAPPIHDITTDVSDPPRFETAPELRGAGTNSLELQEEVLEQQIQAYPELQTLRSPRAYASSYNLALQTARDLGWEITREDPNAGFIEAVDATSIMNFKDDIIIRVRTNADGSLIDLRSASRVGISDLGANSKRIKAFLDAFAANS